MFKFFKKNVQPTVGEEPSVKVSTLETLLKFADIGGGLQGIYDRATRTVVQMHAREEALEANANGIINEAEKTFADEMSAAVARRDEKVAEATPMLREASDLAAQAKAGEEILAELADLVG